MIVLIVEIFFPKWPKCPKFWFQIKLIQQNNSQLQNVTRSKFWKEIEEWVPEPKTKRMRLTQEEMTQQPAEGFLPLDPYFMGTWPTMLNLLYQYNSITCVLSSCVRCPLKKLGKEIIYYITFGCFFVHTTMRTFKSSNDSQSFRSHLTSPSIN